MKCSKCGSMFVKDSYEEEMMLAETIVSLGAQGKDEELRKLCRKMCENQFGKGFWNG